MYNWIGIQTELRLEVSHWDPSDFDIGRQERFQLSSVCLAVECADFEKSLQQNIFLFLSLSRSIFGFGKMQYGGMFLFLGDKLPDLTYFRQFDFSNGL